MGWVISELLKEEIRLVAGTGPPAPQRPSFSLLKILKINPACKEKTLDTNSILLYDRTGD